MVRACGNPVWYRYTTRASDFRSPHDGHRLGDRHRIQLPLERLSDAQPVVPQSYWIGITALPDQAKSGARSGR